MFPSLVMPDEEDNFLSEDLSDVERKVIRKLIENSRNEENNRKKALAALLISEELLNKDPQTFFTISTVESRVELIHYVNPKDKADKIKIL